MWKFNFLIICLTFAFGAFAEQTLTLIKPDAVSAHHIGEIINRFERNGLKVRGIKMVKLTEQQTSEFYAVHKGQTFYPTLVKYVSSGPVVAIVLDGDNAVAKNRELIGATDPNKATPGTIRRDFATSISQNAVHGSDSLEAAKKEIVFFFKSDEILQP